MLPLLALAALAAVALIASRASAAPPIPPAPAGADPRAWARLSPGQREAALRAMAVAPQHAAAPPQAVARPAAAARPDVVAEYERYIAAMPQYDAGVTARAPTPPTPSPVRSAPAPTRAAPANAAAERTRVLNELRHLKEWAERLPIYTRATWASELVAMKGRAEALRARNWPLAESTQLLADARRLRAQIEA